MIDADPAVAGTVRPAAVPPVGPDRSGVGSGLVARTALVVPVALLVALLVATSVVVAPSSISAADVEGAAPPAEARAAPCTESPFTIGLDMELRRRWPGRRISASVHDTRTGCTYAYRGDLRITTASVLKAAIMGAVILRAQQAGRALTTAEVARIGPMIRTSDDPSANALWSSVGGVSGMASFDRQIGLGATTETSPWGLTSTSAADRTLVLRRMLLGDGGPFTATSRARARAFMLDVTPSQRWGITAGVPSAWSVPLKNGFFPASCCGWRVNTSGVVERPGGGAYAATVLSDGWPSLAAGIPAVELVSRTIASWTLVAIGPHLSPARFAHQAFADVAGRRPSFAEEQAIAARIGAETRGAARPLADLLADPDLDRTSGALLRLYLVALGRLPEPGTWSGRLGQLRSRAISLPVIGDVLAASGEFTGGVALSPEAFVDLAYQRTYGRAPSAAERAYWVGRFGAGAGRGTLLVALADSDGVRWWRSRTVQVATAYLTLLRTLPSSGSLAWWERRLWDGAPLSDLAGALFTSVAYADRFPNGR